MAFDIDTIDFDTLSSVWLETYGNCNIRAIFANDAISPKQLRDKRALAKKITAFLALLDIPATPLCIERLIDAIEPVEDTRDYIAELGSEEMDIDTEDIGC